MCVTLNVFLCFLACCKISERNPTDIGFILYIEQKTQIIFDITQFHLLCLTSCNCLPLDLCSCTDLHWSASSSRWYSLFKTVVYWLTISLSVSIKINHRKWAVSVILLFSTHPSWFWRRFLGLQVKSWMTSGRYHWSLGDGGTWVVSPGGRDRGRAIWVNLSLSSIALEQTGDMGAAWHWQGSSLTLLRWGWLNWCNALPERQLSYFIFLHLSLCTVCSHNNIWDICRPTHITITRTNGHIEWTNAMKRFIVKWQLLIALFVGHCYSAHFSFLHVLFSQPQCNT